MATNLTDKTCAAFERAFDWAWEDDSIGWSGFAWRIWQASTAEADAKYLPVIEKLVAIVNQQAEDEGLWFVAQYASEGYLQKELRLLHAAIEELAKPLLGKKGKV